MRFSLAFVSCFMAMLLGLCGCAQSSQSVAQDNPRSSVSSTSMRSASNVAGAGDNDISKIVDSNGNKPDSDASLNTKNDVFDLDQMLALADKSRKSGGRWYFVREGSDYRSLDAYLYEKENCWNCETHESMNVYFAQDDPFKTILSMDESIIDIASGSDIVTTNANDIVLYPILGEWYSTSVSSGYSFGYDEVQGESYDGSTEEFAEVLSRFGIRYMDRLALSKEAASFTRGRYEGTKFVEEVVPVDIPCLEANEDCVEFSWKRDKQPNGFKGSFLDLSPTKEGYATASLSGYEPGLYLVRSYNSFGNVFFPIRII